MDTLEVAHREFTTSCVLQLRDRMVAIVEEMKCGDAEDYTSFTSAVIDHNVSKPMYAFCRARVEPPYIPHVGTSYFSSLGD